MKIRVTSDFRWAHDGHRVVTYKPGVHDVPDDCAAVAVREGWAKKHSAEKTEPEDPKGDGKTDGKGGGGRAG